jgi:hypothetical protein
MSNWLGLTAEQRQIDQIKVHQCRSEFLGGETSLEDLLSRDLGGCLAKETSMVSVVNTSAQERLDTQVFYGTLIVGALLLVIFYRRILRLLDGLLINTGASVIKARNSSKAYRQSVRDRVASKVREAESEK